MSTRCLAIAAVFALLGLQLKLAAQIPSGQSERRRLANPTKNAPEVSREADSGPVSVETSAEARRLYKSGLQYKQAGLFSQATELFERAVKLKPDYAEAYYALGQAYFNMKRWEKAVESLQQAVVLDPKNKHARDQLDQAQLIRERETGRSDASASEPGPMSHAGTQDSLNVTSSPSIVRTAKVSADEQALTTIYRVGPGDVLDVRVNDVASTESTAFTITPSGFLEHPGLAQPLPVVGLTVDEISSKFEDDLKRGGLGADTRVSVGVRDYVSHAILVSGLVKEPGTKILRREAIPLYVVVADAQPLREAAKAILFQKKSNQVYTVDLAEPVDMNLLVHPGDVLTIEANPTQFFYIGGEVKSPGEKPFRRGLTLTQAIIIAGGLNGKSGEARLARDDGKGFLVMIRYKLKDIDSGKRPDPLIQAGDRITITN